MLSEEAVIYQLATDLVGQFPAAMDSPLVGASVFGPKTQQFYTVGRNVMRLLPVGYEDIHAEEVALEAYASSPSEEVHEELYIITTLEPCPKRSTHNGKRKPSCRERIVEFAKTYKIEKVIIGILETGKGLQYLLDNNLKVSLLHGAKQQQYIEEKFQGDGRNPRPALAELQRTKTNLLQIIDATEIDHINAEEHPRFLRAIKMRQERINEVLSTIRATQQEAEPFLLLHEAFPTIFPVKARDEFEILRGAAKTNPSKPVEDVFAQFVGRRARTELNGIRNKQIEQELRSKVK